MDGGAWWAAVHGVTKSRTQLTRHSSSSSGYQVCLTGKRSKSETEWKRHAYFGLPWWLRSKESGCNAGDAGDVGSILMLERSSGSNSSILAWEILWTGEPGRLESMELPRVGRDFSSVYISRSVMSDSATP